MKRRATKMTRREAFDEVEATLDRVPNGGFIPRRKVGRIERLLERIRTCDEDQRAYEEALAIRSVDFPSEPQEEA